MAALADDDMSEGTEEFTLQLVTGNVAIVAGGSASVMIQNGIFGDLNLEHVLIKSYFNRAPIREVSLLWSLLYYNGLFMLMYPYN